MGAQGLADVPDGVRVVDAHVHVNRFDLMRPAVRQAIASNPTFPLMARLVADPQAMLSHMDAEGVWQAWLINYCARKVMGYGPEVNAWAADYAKADPRRLVAVGGLDLDAPHPPGPDEVKELRRLGIRAVKVHTVHQHVRPDDPRLEAAFAELERVRMPVIFHTGTSRFPGADNAFADPSPIGAVCLRHPDLPVIVAHGGRPDHTRQAMELLRNHRNAWLDLSSCPPHRLHAYFGDLAAVADRTLWGSDWPGPGVPGMGANVQAFLGLGLPEDAYRKILHGNAVGLLAATRAA